MSSPTPHHLPLATTPRQWRTPTPQLAFITIIALCVLPYLVYAVSKHRAAATKAGLTERAETRQPSDRHSLVAINPTTRSGEGYEVRTSYAGPEYLRVALEQNRA